MERKRFKMKILSPVHIGSNRALEPLDYVVLDNYLYFIDFSAFFAQKELAKDIFGSNKNTVYIRQKMRDVFLRFKNEGKISQFTVSKVKVSKELADEYEKNLSRIESSLQVLLFPRNPKPYIPGSSIKGAIRTGVLNEMANYEKGRNCDNKNTRVYSKKTGKSYLDSRKVEYCLLKAQVQGRDGRFRNDFSRDPFQYLKVSDAEVEGSTKVVLCGNYSFAKSYKRGIPTKREVVYSDAEREIVFEVVFDKERAEKNISLDVNGIDGFLHYAGEFYRKKLKLLIKNLQENAKNFGGRDDVLSELESVCSKAVSGSCLLRIGFGSGYDCVTLEKYRKQKEPQRGRPGKGWGYSINLAEGRRPLGWVMLVEY